MKSFVCNRWRFHKKADVFDGRITGFAGLSIWAYGFALWSGVCIWRALHRPRSWDRMHRTYWQLTAFFWAGWAGYLLNGFSAHGFYRTWWLSLAFSLLGVLLGACVHGILAGNREEERLTACSSFTASACPKKGTPQD